ncbi:hypothetical protein [Enterococcus faecalis]|uniref:hypothetical protein n=1 Tax=Enterococcus faecalis TaxID=1351 RepID=UPI0040432154
MLVGFSLLGILIGCEVKETNSQYTKETTKASSTKTNESSSEKQTSDIEKNNNIIAKKISKNWYDNQIQIDNQVLTMPIKLKDLNNLGFELKYSEPYVLNPNDSVMGTHLTNKKGNTISGTYSNLTDKAIDIKESSLTSINITDTTNKDLNIFFPGEVTWGSSIEEIKKIYGEPKDEYVGDSGFSILTYQEDTDHYAKLTFSNGKLKGYELYI